MGFNGILWYIPSGYYKIAIQHEHIKSGFSNKKLVIFHSYVTTLVNVYITMENHHAIDGKTHYFDWAIFNSKLLVITRG